MKFRDVLAGTSVAEWTGDPEVGIADLAYDSRQVEPGSLFFCVVGERSDGHEFAPIAAERGAAALVVERHLDLDLPQARVESARAAMAPAAVRFWGDPTAELRLAGITGTNGKTTAAFLVRHVLERTGTQTGLLGTVKRVVGGVEEEVERTTPEAIDLQRTFRRMLDAGDRACAMEVSSHALALGRADGVRFAVAAFTNLTQDHLDFHTDMEDYFQAKRLLFSAGQAERALANLDDPYGARLAAEFDCLTFSPSGAEAADFRAVEASFDATGSRFVCVGPDGQRADVATALPGHFNVENALCAIGIGTAMGVPLADGAAALADAPRVPGRLEPVDEGQPFAVLVDYAHTPDSLENVLRSARRITGGRLISVFGAGGDRDRAKRPVMGEIAARLSDVAVVTSDNPRSEDPDAIVAEILAGMPGTASNGEDAAVRVEVDRRAAIALAIAAAAPGDTVVIAGKGHEQGQEFEGGRKIPFDDRAVAREELRRATGATPPTASGTRSS
jgi:UDP-N-acetylmuramoyl-L-alanyl-D-glutamate--2,6-diaminopimelate ligase